VTYAFEPKLGMLVPAEMLETYEAPIAVGLYRRRQHDEGQLPGDLQRLQAVRNVGRMSCRSDGRGACARQGSLGSAHGRSRDGVQEERAQVKVPFLGFGRGFACTCSGRCGEPVGIEPTTTALKVRYMMAVSRPPAVSLSISFSPCASCGGCWWPFVLP